MKAIVKVISLLLFIYLINLSFCLTCSSGKSECGSTCYDVSIYECINGVVCPKGQKTCGLTCYDPILHQCLNGAVCLKNQSVCGKICFDPASYYCSGGFLYPRSGEI